MNIHNGLTAAHLPAALDIFLDAFSEELLPILGPEKKAREMLNLMMDRKNVFTAVEDGTVIGILGYMKKNDAFLKTLPQDFFRIYGFLPGMLRLIGFSLFGYSAKEDELYIEYLAVSASARGRGIGTKLIEAAKAYAIEKGFRVLSLEVVDTNPGARKLYTRLGFHKKYAYGIWPFNRILGWPFKKIYCLQKRLS